ncbi:MAG: SDR family oxidoreductase [Pseudomonadota bacterium]
MAKRVAIISQSASPLGRACAKKFCEAGYRLVLSDPDDDAGRAAAEALFERSEDLRFVTGDGANRLHVHNIVAEALEAFGRVDVAVSAPAPRKIQDNEETKFHELADDEFQTRGLDPLLRAILINQAAIKQFLKQSEDVAPGDEAGSIVNIAFSEAPSITRPADSIAGGGVFALTKTLANAYAQSAIRVNAVRAAGVLGGQYTNREKDVLRTAAPSGRFVDVDAVAEIVGFLASPEAAGVNGQVMTVDGAGLFSVRALAKKLPKKSPS